MLRDLSGVKAAKPRLKPAKEELPELSREYLQIRNQQMRTKNLCAEMQLTERRGELIEKSLVERQGGLSPGRVEAGDSERSANLVPQAHGVE